MKISKRSWGVIDGQEVFLFEMQHEDGIRACVSNYGGVLQALFVQDGCKRELDVVLGYDTPEEYRESETFFGAMIGPIADRLDGGSCVLGGKRVQLPLNAGPDSMHSGPNGFHSQIWDWAYLDDGVSFFRRFGDGEIGFGGTLDVRLNYRIPAPDTLRLEYSAHCDQETALSMTNHSYFNLDGGAKHCRDQRITLHASRYAETCREQDPICTGCTPSVEGMPFDMREGRLLAEVLKAKDFRELRTGGGIDHYFLTDGEGMREHSCIESLESGLTLRCRSDATGLLVYSGNGLETEHGKNGSVYEKNWGICLETQSFPNGVNLSEWREQLLLARGEEYTSATEFVFSAK